MDAQGSSDLRGHGEPPAERKLTLLSNFATPGTVVVGESPAVGDDGAGKHTPLSDISSAATSGGTHRRSGGRRRLNHNGRAGMRRVVLRRQVDAKVREDIERRRVRAQLVAEIAAAEDAKRARSERSPAPLGQVLQLPRRVHDIGRRDARPAAPRAANSTGGSSDPDGESEPGPSGSGLTPSLAFTGPRAALARAIARWEASGEAWEVPDAPFGLWRVRAAHCRRLERLGVFDEAAERRRPS